MDVGSDDKDKKPLIMFNKWEIRLSDGTEIDYSKDYTGVFHAEDKEFIFDRTKMPEFGVEFKANVEFHKLFDDFEDRVREHFPLLPDNAVLMTAKFIDVGDVILNRSGVETLRVIRKGHKALIAKPVVNVDIEFRIPADVSGLFAIIPKDKQP